MTTCQQQRLPGDVSWRAPIGRGPLGTVGIAVQGALLLACTAACLPPDPQEGVGIEPGVQTDPGSTTIDAPNQPPVVAIVCPEAAALGESIAVDIEVSDVDGEVVDQAVTLDGAPVELPVSMLDAGLRTIAVVVTDNGGSSATGACRVHVAAPDAGPDEVEPDVVVEPDPEEPAWAPPEVEELAVEGEGATEGGVHPDAVIEVFVAALEGDEPLAEIRLEAEGATGPALIAPGPVASVSSDAPTATFFVATPTEGTLSLRAVASDVLGAESEVFEVELGIIPPPPVGAEVKAWLLPFGEDGFPTSLVGRQRAEDIAAEVATTDAVYVTTTEEPFLAAPSTEEGLVGLPGLADGPDQVDSIAVVYRSTVTPPEGAATVVFEASGDDVVVVYLDLEPVASADAEYAVDFTGFTKVPPVSAAIPVDEAPLTVRILAANEFGAMEWSVAATFADASGTPLGAGTWSTPADAD